jgi:formyltetrahydrofolate deformylase
MGLRVGISKMKKSYVFTLSCDDRPGLIAAVATQLYECGGNIVEAQQYDDPATGRFFMRMAFDLTSPEIDVQTVTRRLSGIAHLIGREWSLRPAEAGKRVLILVSKHDHCLADLLYRTRIGEMAMDIVGVVSNHPQSALHVADLIGDIPFHHLPVTPETKPVQEHRIKQIVEETGAELVVLARYMQILSDDLAAFLAGRCINIHHSFLPGFKGAQPYHQAHARGVKIIGATAHYVTGDLDEGPIIEQDVMYVSHADTPETLTRKGRDIERRVLSRAVIFHLQDRVLVNGSTTVVFR